MSTIKVNSIKNASTDDGIAIDNGGHVQLTVNSCRLLVR